MEFGLIAPVLLLLCFAIVDFAAAVRVQIGVDQAARAVANLIVQQSAVTTAQLDDFYIAGRDCYAFNSGTFSISAASVTFPPAPSGWDAADYSGHFAPSPGNLLTLSAGLAASSGGSVVGGDSTIVVQARSTFAIPLAFWPIPSSLTFTSTEFARPRLSFVVTAPN